ncbi:MAG TPA: Mur ligase domain-containing protein [Kiritimatiellia bacterium]|nr:Mur ligase domain-containing protein [Kiritimatiellia bacterium]HRZ13761.1 Mur ligase domain-containing protein [Kiritimatiellia bacterium]HSA19700.1 Mur ligase domain-containing protein [Kiritimatiellia bacterium]
MADHVHFVGVAGVGMSALAQALLARGARVTGSDRFLDQGQPPESLAVLRAAGVELAPQDGSGVTAATRAVVVSTAVEPDNRDVAAARSRGVEVVHRAEMLARLVRGRRLLAVAGTSGKTTVTGLVGWLLERCGRNPTIVNGGAVLGWKGPRSLGNFRAGRDDLWVIEADESDRSFLQFDPDWEIITNLSRDHFELGETTDLFRSFARRAASGVVCGPGVAGLLRAGQADPGQAMLFEESLELVPRGFVREDVTFEVPLPGRHNVENAWLAVQLCRHLGLHGGPLRMALASFPGIERRLERAGEAAGVAVVDDYAHNPAKIAAAWSTMAGRHARVLGVWRPHGFGPLAAMMPELVESLLRVMRPADQLFLLPVFYAGGTARQTVSSEDLASRLQAAGRTAVAMESYDALEHRVLAVAHPGDLVLVMGARDPELPRFARRMVHSLASRPAGGAPAGVL